MPSPLNPIFDCRRLPGLAARLQRMCKRPHFGIYAHTLSMAHIVTHSGHPQWWETLRLPTSALAKCNRSVRNNAPSFSGPRHTHTTSKIIYFYLLEHGGGARAGSFFTTPNLRLRTRQTRAYLSDASTIMIRKGKTSSCQDHSLTVPSGSGPVERDA